MTDSVRIATRLALLVLAALLLVLGLGAALAQAHAPECPGERNKHGTCIYRGQPWWFEDVKACVLADLTYEQCFYVYHCEDVAKCAARYLPQMSGRSGSGGNGGQGDGGTTGSEGGAPVYNPPLLVHPPGDGSPNWHLRAGPGKHFRSLGGVEPGAYVRVLETDCTDGVNTWARIGYGALTGWIHGGWALGINACI